MDIKKFINSISGNYENKEVSIRVHSFIDKFLGLLYGGIKSNKLDKSIDIVFLDKLLDVYIENNWDFDKNKYSKKLTEIKIEEYKDIDILTKNIITSKDYINNSIKNSKREHKKLYHLDPTNKCLFRGILCIISKKWLDNTISQCEITHIDLRCITSSIVINSICNYLIRNKNGVIALNDDIIKEKILMPGYNKLKFKKHKKEFKEYENIILSPVDEILNQLDLNKNYVLVSMCVGLWVIKKLRKLIIDDVDKDLIYDKILDELSQLENTKNIKIDNTNYIITGAIIGCYLGASKLDNLPVNKKILNLFC